MSTDTEHDSMWRKCQVLESTMRHNLKKLTPFDPAVQKIRTQLKTEYLRLLENDLRLAVEKDILRNLWKNVFYKQIESCRRTLRTSDIKKNPNAKPHEYEKALNRLNNDLIPNAKQLYETLLRQHLHKCKISYDGSTLKDKIVLQPKEVDSTFQGDSPYYSLVIAHKCFIYLGDLERYSRMYMDQDYSEAEVYYQKACQLLPAQGNPHNQLAVLATYSQNDITAVYEYLLSLWVAKPFVTSEENLRLLFQKHFTIVSKMCGVDFSFDPHSHNAIGTQQSNTDNHPTSIGDMLQNTPQIRADKILKCLRRVTEWNWLESFVIFALGIMFERNTDNLKLLPLFRDCLLSKIKTIVFRPLRRNLNSVTTEEIHEADSGESGSEADSALPNTTGNHHKYNFDLPRTGATLSKKTAIEAAKSNNSSAPIPRRQLTQIALKLLVCSVYLVHHCHDHCTTPSANSKASNTSNSTTDTAHSSPIDSLIAGLDGRMAGYFEAICWTLSYLAHMMESMSPQNLSLLVPISVGCEWLQKNFHFAIPDLNLEPWMHIQLEPKHLAPNNDLFGQLAALLNLLDDDYAVDVSGDDSLPFSKKHDRLLPEETMFTGVPDFLYSTLSPDPTAFFDRRRNKEHLQSLLERREQKQKSRNASANSSPTAQPLSLSLNEEKSSTVDETELDEWHCNYRRFSKLVSFAQFAGKKVDGVLLYEGGMWAANRLLTVSNQNELEAIGAHLERIFLEKQAQQEAIARAEAEAEFRAVQQQQQAAAAVMAARELQQKQEQHRQQMQQLQQRELASQQDQSQFMAGVPQLTPYSHTHTHTPRRDTDHMPAALAPHRSADAIMSVVDRTFGGAVHHNSGAHNSSTHHQRHNSQPQPGMTIPPPQRTMTSHEMLWNPNHQMFDSHITYGRSQTVRILPSQQSHNMHSYLSGTRTPREHTSLTPRDPLASLPQQHAHTPRMHMQQQQQQQQQQQPSHGVGSSAATLQNVQHFSPYHSGGALQNDSIYSGSGVMPPQRPMALISPRTAEETYPNQPDDTERDPNTRSWMDLRQSLMRERVTNQPQKKTKYQSRSAPASPRGELPLTTNESLFRFNNPPLFEEMDEIDFPLYPNAQAVMQPQPPPQHPQSHQQSHQPTSSTAAFERSRKGAPPPYNRSRSSSYGGAHHSVIVPEHSAVDYYHDNQPTQTTPASTTPHGMMRMSPDRNNIAGQTRTLSQPPTHKPQWASHGISPAYHMQQASPQLQVRVPPQPQMGVAVAGKSTHPSTHPHPHHSVSANSTPTKGDRRDISFAMFENPLPPAYLQSSGRPTKETLPATQPCTPTTYSRTRGLPPTRYSANMEFSPPRSPPVFFFKGQIIKEDQVPPDAPQPTQGRQHHALFGPNSQQQPPQPPPQQQQQQQPSQQVSQQHPHYLYNSEAMVAGPPSDPYQISPQLTPTMHLAYS